MSKMYGSDKGVGTKYKANVSVRSDKVKTGGDIPMSGTASAFSKAHKDNKKC